MYKNISVDLVHGGTATNLKPVYLTIYNNKIYGLLDHSKWQDNTMSLLIANIDGSNAVTTLVHTFTGWHQFKGIFGYNNRIYYLWNEDVGPEPTTNIFVGHTDLSGGDFTIIQVTNSATIHMYGEHAKIIGDTIYFALEYWDTNWDFGNAGLITFDLITGTVITSTLFEYSGSYIEAYPRQMTVADGSIYYLLETWTAGWGEDHIVIAVCNLDGTNFRIIKIFNSPLESFPESTLIGLTLQKFNNKLIFLYRIRAGGIWNTDGLYAVALDITTGEFDKHIVYDIGTAISSIDINLQDDYLNISLRSGSGASGITIAGKLSLEKFTFTYVNWGNMPITTVLSEPYASTYYKEIKQIIYQDKNYYFFITYPSSYPTTADLDPALRLISGQYIPIANLDDFNSISSKTVRTFAQGTQWEVMAEGGLDKDYIQVADLNWTGIATCQTIGMQGDINLTNQSIFSCTSTLQEVRSVQLTFEQTTQVTFRTGVVRAGQSFQTRIYNDSIEISGAGTNHGTGGTVGTWAYMSSGPHTFPAGTHNFRYMMLGTSYSYPIGNLSFDIMTIGSCFEGVYEGNNKSWLNINMNFDGLKPLIYGLNNGIFQNINIESPKFLNIQTFVTDGSSSGDGAKRPHAFLFSLLSNHAVVSNVKINNLDMVMQYIEYPTFNYSNGMSVIARQTEGIVSIIDADLSGTIRSGGGYVYDFKNSFVGGWVAYIYGNLEMVNCSSNLSIIDNLVDSSALLFHEIWFTEANRRVSLRNCKIVGDIYGSYSSFICRDISTQSTVSANSCNIVIENCDFEGRIITDAPWYSEGHGLMGWVDNVNLFFNGNNVLLESHNGGSTSTSGAISSSFMSRSYDGKVLPKCQVKNNIVKYKISGGEQHSPRPSNAWMRYFGGLFGFIRETDIEVSQNSVEAIYECEGGYANVAGLAGYTSDIKGIISENVITGHVKQKYYIDYPSDVWADGISGIISSFQSSATLAGVGSLHLDIVNNYSRFNIEIENQGESPIASYIGGLIGIISAPLQSTAQVSLNIENCYVAGKINTKNIPNQFQAIYGISPLAIASSGRQTATTVASCYWDSQISVAEGVSYGAPLTTAQMKNKLNYLNWDFETIWRIEE